MLSEDDAIAGLNFTIFNKHQIVINNVTKEMISTSITMLVSHHELGAVYNYVRLRVFADNTVATLPVISGVF